MDLKVIYIASRIGIAGYHIGMLLLCMMNGRAWVLTGGSQPPSFIPPPSTLLPSVNPRLQELSLEAHSPLWWRSKRHFSANWSILIEANVKRWGGKGGRVGSFGGEAGSSPLSHLWAVTLASLPPCQLLANSCTSTLAGWGWRRLVFSVAFWTFGAGIASSTHGMCSWNWQMKSWFHLYNCAVPLWPLAWVANGTGFCWQRGLVSFGISVFYWCIHVCW